MRGVLRPSALVDMWLELMPARRAATAKALQMVIEEAGPELVASVRWGHLVFSVANQTPIAVAPYKPNAHLLIFNGALIARRFPMLIGSGPGMRHLCFRHGDPIDTELVAALVKASVSVLRPPTRLSQTR
jgi:hypothetical protein